MCQVRNLGNNGQVIATKLFRLTPRLTVAKQAADEHVESITGTSVPQMDFAFD
jgi:hypothetical protein